MNRVLLGILIVSFSFINCQGKVKEKESKEVVIEQPNSIEENDMNEQESKKRIDVIVSGDSLKDAKRTLKALENLLQAMNKRHDIEFGDVEDTLGVAFEDYPILERVDIETINELFSKAFQQAGVKKPSEEVFNASIKRIFQVDVNNFQVRKRAWEKIDNIVLIPAYIHQHDFLKGVTENPYKVGYPEQANYYFDIQNRFTLEKMLVPNYFIEVKQDESFVFWNSLDQIYNKDKNEFYLSIDKFTLEFNKYVFYNDKSSFSWLFRNKPFEFSNLLTSFSYEAEPLLNGWVLNDKSKRIRKKEDEGSKYAIRELKDLFAIKNYQNQVEIREELMKYIDKGTTLEDNDWLLMLDNYASEIVNFDNGYSRTLREGYTKEELYKIFAYSAYYSYKGFAKFDMGLGKYSSTRENWPNFCALTSIGQNDDVQEALKKNNYYNLPGLKEVVDKINTLK